MRSDRPRVRRIDPREIFFQVTLDARRWVGRSLESPTLRCLKETLQWRWVREAEVAVYSLEVGHAKSGSLRCYGLRFFAYLCKVKSFICTTYCTFSIDSSIHCIIARRQAEAAEAAGWQSIRALWMESLVALGLATESFRGEDLL